MAEMATYVEIGNEHAIEGYRPPEDPSRLLYRPIEGQRVTRLEFPPGVGIQEAISATVDAMRHHMAATNKRGVINKPSWIESNDEGLLDALLAHWSLPAKNNIRPVDWGQASEDEA